MMSSPCILAQLWQPDFSRQLFLTGYWYSHIVILPHSSSTPIFVGCFLVEPLYISLAHKALEDGITSVLFTTEIKLKIDPILGP